MYIWLGIDIDGQLEKMKKAAVAIDREIGFKNSCFTLPQHISIKMSFRVDDEMFDSVLADVEAFYRSLAPFDVFISGPELDKNIAWIRMKNNADIDRIHIDINELLLKKYNIPLHEYDMDFKFHSTLFMDSDESLVAKAFDAVKATELPLKVRANKFVIGTSATGALGTYSVFKTIVI